MQNIVFLDRQSLRAELRSPAFAHAWTEHVQTRPEDVIERLQGATVAISNKVPIRRETLAQLPDLKLIAMADLAMLHCFVAAGLININL
jgi:glycerate dehydrogenase